MDLWIRSQDKRILIQPNRIDIDGKAIIVWQNNYNCDETFLGAYKTKERALEVLDEIQTQLVTLNYQYLHRGEHFIATESNVYEMPEE